PLCGQRVVERPRPPVRDAPRSEPPRPPGKKISRSAHPFSGVDRRPCESGPRSLGGPHQESPTMASVSTYLCFRGQTEAAFEFYKAIFKTDYAGPIHRIRDV